MKLLVAADVHIFTTPNGEHWCKTIYGYDFWKRYLTVFDSIRIVGREKMVDSVPDRYLLMDGAGVEIFGIPFFQGPKQLLFKYASISKVLKKAYEGVDAGIFRMPSQTAYMVYKKRPSNLPIAGEIVYDPSNDAENMAYGILLRCIFKRISRQLKNFCLNANGVSYVTKNAIQSKYPSHARLYGESEDYFESAYSTITLSNGAYLGPRDYHNNQDKLTLALSSVSMNSERKGERILIDIVKQTRNLGYNVDAILIGDGTLRPSFEQYAEDIGLQSYIRFTGLLPTPDDVRSVLKDADIFVFPTQGEGLPRGIIEAMAMGLPVLSTPVGGIPEIIDDEYLYNPNDVDGFVTTICRLFNNPKELSQMSENNYNKSLEFENTVLQSKRNDFYKKLFDLCD